MTTEGTCPSQRPLQVQTQVRDPWGSSLEPYNCKTEPKLFTPLSKFSLISYTIFTLKHWQKWRKKQTKTWKTSTNPLRKLKKTSNKIKIYKNSILCFDLKVHNYIYPLLGNKKALFLFLLKIWIVDKIMLYKRNGSPSLCNFSAHTILYFLAKYDIVIWKKIT